MIHDFSFNWYRGAKGEQGDRGQKGESGQIPKMILDKRGYKGEPGPRGLEGLKGFKGFYLIDLHTDATFNCCLLKENLVMLVLLVLMAQLALEVFPEMLSLYDYKNALLNFIIKI